MTAIILQSQTVTYQIDSKKTALGEVNTKTLSLPDVSVSKGKHTLILGASGCGKTTLLHILAGLLRPTSGMVTFEGQSFATLPENALDNLRAKHFGFVFQRLHLLGHLSVLQNILLAGAAAHIEIDVMVVQTVLADLGLSDKARQQASHLSVGEAQRVAIARAVIHNPSIIFADEPTSALDDANAERVMDLLLRQAERTGATLVVATHDARIKGKFLNLTEVV